MNPIRTGAAVAAAFWLWGAVALAQAPAPKLELTEEQKKAEEAFALADGLYRKGFYDRALPALTQFVATYPQHANAPLGLLEAGECWYAQQKYAEAVPLYQRVLAEYPKSRELDAAAYRLGQCKFGLADYPGALAAFRDLLEKAPESQYRAAALYWTGESHFRAEHLEDAVKAYAESRRLAPQGQYAAYALYSIGISQQRLNRPQEAVATFRAVLKEYADSPVAADSGIRLGEALYAGGQTAEALAVFDGVLKSAQPDLLARALHGLAWCHFDAKRWPEARAAFERLLKECPNDPLAVADRRRVADCLYHEGRFADAARAYQTALTGLTGNDAADVLFWQAVAFEKAGDQQAAAAAYQRLATEHPTSPPAAKASLRLADTAAEKKDLAAAERAYRTAASSADPALKAQGELGLAWIASQKGDAAGALAQYERLGRADPSSAAGGQALLQGAGLALAAKNPAKAAELCGLFLQAGATRDGAAEAHYLLGLARLAADDKPTAARELEAAVNAAPKADFTAAALGRLAQLYRQSGDNARADATLARLKRDFPQSGAGAQAQYATACELLRAGKLAEARRAYEAALAAAGDPATAALCQLGIGNTHFQEQHFDPALAAYRLALEKQPQGEAAEPAEYQIGVCLSRLEKYPEATAALSKFRADRPQSDLAPRAASELAWVHLRAGQKDQAAALYEQLIAAPKTSPDLAADALFRLGEIAYDRREYEQALARYTDLTTKFPQSDLLDEALYKRAWSLAQLKRAEESLEAFRRCLEAKPSPEIAADCRFRLASALIAKGDWAGAEAALRATPDSGDAAYRARRALLLGQALLGLKRSEEAMKQLALAADSTDAETAAAAQFGLAAALLEAGQWAKAADGFLRVAIVHGDSPHAPRALFEAGQCFERTNAKEDALKAYRSLIKDYPQATEWTEKAKARVQALGG